MSRGILFVLLFFTLDSFAQSDLKCSIETLVRIDRNLENLRRADIFELLATFDRTCDINVEYSEYSNELLFKVLDAYPKATLAILERHKANFAVEKILEELADPVTDLIDINALILKVSRVQSNKVVHQKIIEALKNALDKAS